jgi:hypothetical protein
MTTKPKSPFWAWSLRRRSFTSRNATAGCVERFIRTLKEELRVRVFQNVEELWSALAEFRERYNLTLDRPPLGLPHAGPSAPATPCARTCCMNTLNSLSKKSSAKHMFFITGDFLHVFSTPKYRY